MIVEFNDIEFAWQDPLVDHAKLPFFVIPFHGSHGITLPAFSLDKSCSIDLQPLCCRLPLPPEI
jgi:hypothetical protein